MARFLAGCVGGRGEATRLGHGKTGARAYVQGWEVGARVEAQADGDGDGDGDKVHVYATHGSNGRGGSVFLGTIRADGEGRLTWEGGTILPPHEAPAGAMAGG